MCDDFGCLSLLMNTARSKDHLPLGAACRFVFCSRHWQALNQRQPSVAGVGDWPPGLSQRRLGALLQSMVPTVHLCQLKASDTDRVAIQWPAPIAGDSTMKSAGFFHLEFRPQLSLPGFSFELSHRGVGYDIPTPASFPYKSVEKCSVVTMQALSSLLHQRCLPRRVCTGFGIIPGPLCPELLFDPVVGVLRAIRCTVVLDLTSGHGAYQQHSCPSCTTTADTIHRRVGRAEERTDAIAAKKTPFSSDQSRASS